MWALRKGSVALEVNYAASLVKSIENVFSTLLQTRVRPCPLAPGTPDPPNWGITGVVNLSGDVSRAVTLSFPADTAERLVNLFVGMPVKPDSESFATTIGELVSIVAGNTRADLVGKRVSLSCPTVIRGERRKAPRERKSPAVVLACESDIGPFRAEFAECEAGQAAGAPELAA